MPIDENKPFRYGSACSGIEAASQAWHPLGWKPAFFSEIESFPCSVLSHRYPETQNLGDMTKFSDWPDYAIDLLVGGTPCQSFSVAGLRAGLRDPRGNLMLTFLAIAARYRPRWIVWENVPGVLSSEGGRDFGTFLGGLGLCGYGFAYRVLDAQFVRVESHRRAVPQRRRRVFVVGHLGDWRRAAAVLFESQSVFGYPPPSRSSGQRVAPTIAARTRGGGGLGADFDCDGGLIAHTLLGKENSPHAAYVDTYIASEVAPTLNAQFSNAQGIDNQHIDSGGACSLPPVAFALTTRNERNEPTTETLIPTLQGGFFDDSIAFSCKDHGADSGEVSPTLRSMNSNGSHPNGGGQVAIALHPTQDPISSEDGTAHAMSCGSSDGQATVAVATQIRRGKRWSVRRLTPLECSRLQGFPDGYLDIRHNGKPAKDGPKYKALGNSMAVNVMRFIGDRIKMVDSI